MAHLWLFSVNLRLQFPFTTTNNNNESKKTKTTKSNEVALWATYTCHLADLITLHVWTWWSGAVCEVFHTVVLIQLLKLPGQQSTAYYNTNRVIDKHVKWNCVTMSKKAVFRPYIVTTWESWGTIVCHRTKVTYVDDADTNLTHTNRHRPKTDGVCISLITSSQSYGRKWPENITWLFQL